MALMSFRADVDSEAQRVGDSRFVDDERGYGGLPRDRLTEVNGVALTPARCCRMRRLAFSRGHGLDAPIDLLGFPQRSKRHRAMPDVEVTVSLLSATSATFVACRSGSRVDVWGPQPGCCVQLLLRDEGSQSVVQRNGGVVGVQVANRVAQGGVETGGDFNREFVVDGP
jgi:hypothetical protein